MCTTGAATDPVPNPTAVVACAVSPNTISPKALGGIASWYAQLTSAADAEPEPDPNAFAKAPLTCSCNRASLSFFLLFRSFLRGLCLCFYWGVSSLGCFCLNCYYEALPQPFPEPSSTFSSTFVPHIRYPAPLPYSWAPTHR